MKHVLWLESVVNPISDRKEQLTIESKFSYYLTIHNSAKRRPGSKLFRNSGVEFLDPLP